MLDDYDIVLFICFVTFYREQDAICMYFIMNLDIQDGSVSAPFTGTAYRVKYFKPIPKEINHDTSTVYT